MLDSRQQHACAKITRNGRDYIAVIGGVGSSPLTTSTIELYDLTTRPNVWKVEAGLSLQGSFPALYGYYVKEFDVDVCFAMFLSVENNVVATCTGNYTWAYYPVNGYVGPWTQAAFVDASFLGVN